MLPVGMKPFPRLFKFHARHLIRKVSSTKSTIKVNGKDYQFDDQYTNVTPSILKLTERALHKNDSHPIGILRNMIETKINTTDSRYTAYNDFSPAVSVFENFDSLDFPKDHPGRSKSDTYYINSNNLLRTHTSAHELECFSDLRKQDSKRSGGFLITADVYRRDEIDRTHYPAFHQMEGARLWSRQDSGETEINKDSPHIKELVGDLKKLENQLKSEKKTEVIIEDDNTLENNPKQSYMTDLEVDLCSQHLKRTIELIVCEVFNRKLESMKAIQDVDHSEIPKELRMRWIKAYFPWTAPSWEIEVWWKGEWLELCGCGLVNQDVLVKAGYQAQSTIGWAFGLGLDRIAMLLFEIPDIRLMWTEDPRFSSQFKPMHISTFKPYSKYPGTIRDVAFWVPSGNEDIIHENDLMEIVRSVAGDLVESVKLLDTFVHPKTSKKSLCYRINYQSMDRNITNNEVNDLQDRVREQLIQRYNLKLR